MARIRVTLKGTKALAWITMLVLKSERKMTAFAAIWVHHFLEHLGL